MCRTNLGAPAPVRCTPACRCDNGAGQVFPYQLCTLKQQPVGGDGRPNLATYASGAGVPWTSGYVVRPPTSSPAAGPPPTPGPSAVQATSGHMPQLPLLPGLEVGGEVQLLP
jgi:hypothetical protein